MTAPDGVFIVHETSQMDVRVAGRGADPNELARFFAANVTPAYISHSELQGYRAVTPDLWAENIEQVVKAEIAERLGRRKKEPRQVVIEGRIDGRLASLALVTLTKRAVVPYGILEDLVIDKTLRSRGFGRAMVAWIADFVRGEGVGRLFLESGERNVDAHRFFQRLGFKPISLVMMWDRPVEGSARR